MVVIMNINDLDVLTNREEEFLKAFIAFFVFI